MQFKILQTTQPRVIDRNKNQTEQLTKPKPTEAISLLPVAQSLLFARNGFDLEIFAIIKLRIY